MSEPELDPAQTSSFTLGPPLTEARGAVLLLHGFTGTPWEVRPLGEALAARGYFVFCPRLPGHGTTPEAMLWAGYNQWIQASYESLQTLAGAKKVVVAGLSMGALLGMVLAAWHPHQVQGLVLLAPVVKMASRDARLLRRLRFLPGLDLLPRWMTKRSMDLQDSEAAAAAPILPRYPLSRVFDLFALQDLARDVLPRITCPSIVVGALSDHVSEPRAVMELAGRLPASKLLMLQRGYHIIPRDQDRALAVTEICQFVDGIGSATS
jgi:carboxylesterase